MCIGCTAYKQYLESIGIQADNSAIRGSFHSSNSDGYGSSSGESSSGEYSAPVSNYSGYGGNRHY